MEGFTEQRLRRYAHSRGDVCDRGTDAAGNVDGSALGIVEVSRWRGGLRQPQPEQGAATGTSFAAGEGINGISEYIFRYSVNGRQAPLNKRGFEGGLPPSELAKGVQGETAATGRVSLYPFLYAAPRAAGRGR